MESSDDIIDTLNLKYINIIKQFINGQINNYIKEFSILDIKDEHGKKMYRTISGIDYTIIENELYKIFFK